MDRNAIPELKAGDEKFVRETAAAFGSREKASAAWVEQGFAYYKRDDLAMAMRRFNQAWLLNPDNPEVYWGFASVLLDRNDPCEAARMSDLTLAKKASNQPAFYPDAGTMYARCGTEKSSLTEAERRIYEQKSEEMFKKAASILPRDEYTLSRWIASRYAWGDYPGAWRKVKEYREAVGKDVDPRIRSMLQAKMPEPK